MDPGCNGTLSFNHSLGSLKLGHILLQLRLSTKISEHQSAVAFTTIYQLPQYTAVYFGALITFSCSFSWKGLLYSNKELLFYVTKSDLLYCGGVGGSGNKIVYASRLSTITP